MALTVGDLLEGKDKPVSVHRHDLLSQALELMLRHDYSQLPVIDDAERLAGMVTSDSIVRATASLGLLPDKVRVGDAMTRARGFDREAVLADVLGTLRDQYAVVVVDGGGLLAGVITNFDVAGYFRRRAEDMMLVEDIEGGVRDHIQAAFQDEAGAVDETRLADIVASMTGPKRDLRGPLGRAISAYLAEEGLAQALDNQRLERVLTDATATKTPPKFDDLNFSQYIDLLLHADVWPVHEDLFAIDRTSLRGMLERVRRTRNALAHFRGEISALDRHHLKYCSEWFERHPPRVRQEAAPPAVLRPPPSEGGSEALAIPDDPVPGESRYARLAVWLQKAEAAEDLVRLTFNQVEEVLGGALPESAREHRTWWANDSVGHLQSKQWLDVGWRVASVSLTDEAVSFRRIQERQADYIDFFSQVRDALQASKVVPLNEASPWGAGWHTFVRMPPDGDRIGLLACSFGRQRKVRVEMYIDTEDESRNLVVLDRLLADRSTIEAAFGEALEWERLPGRRACRIATYLDGAITDDAVSRTSLARQAAESIDQLYRALSEAVQRLSRPD